MINLKQLKTTAYLAPGFSLDCCSFDACWCCPPVCYISDCFSSFWPETAETIRNVLWPQCLLPRPSNHFPNINEALWHWPGRCDQGPLVLTWVNLTHWPQGDFNKVLVKWFSFILAFDGWDFSHEISSRWMSLDFTDDKLALFQVMAWCRQATSYYLSQCWPRSLSPYGVTRPQWVLNPSMHKWLHPSMIKCGMKLPYPFPNFNGCTMDVLGMFK